jgi:hypothetical protein
MANKDIKIVKVSMKIGKTTVEVSPEELEALRTGCFRVGRSGGILHTRVVGGNT